MLKEILINYIFSQIPISFSVICQKQTDGWQKKKKKKNEKFTRFIRPFEPEKIESKFMVFLPSF